MSNIEEELLQEIRELEAEVDEYDHLIGKQSQILTDTINVLKGPPPELTTWSHHDIAEVARQRMQQMEQYSQRLIEASHIILWGAAMQGCNWATDGSVSSWKRIYDETLRLVARDAWEEARLATEDEGNPYKASYEK